MGGAQGSRCSQGLVGDISQARWTPGSHDRHSGGGHRGLLSQVVATQQVQPPLLSWENSLSCSGPACSPPSLHLILACVAHNPCLLTHLLTPFLCPRWEPGGSSELPRLGPAYLLPRDEGCGFGLSCEHERVLSAQLAIPSLGSDLGSGGAVPPVRGLPSSFLALRPLETPGGAEGRKWHPTSASSWVLGDFGELKSHGGGVGRELVLVGLAKTVSFCLSQLS